MGMKKQPAAIVMVLLLASASIAGYLLFQPPPAARAANVAAAPAPDLDRIQFPSGAPQLAMIQAQILPAVGIPAGDTLSARVVYDEDVTARIGVGVNGRVAAIKAAPGSPVHAGQVLAEIDSPDFGAALADLSKARADEERKRKAMERAKELVPGEAIASKDSEAAQSDLDQAHAETLRAQQRVHSINPHGDRIQGQRFSLVSPIDGVVAERSVTPALEVSPGMPAPLFVLTNPKRLWLMIDVPESMLASVRQGASVDVESDAFPNEHFKATIAQPGLVVDPNTRRVTVRARLDNPAGKLLPEMYVRSTLLQERGNAVKVPNTALVNRGVYTYVFVQSAPQQFQRRQVRMLTRGNDASYIGAGVSGGENIVTTGALLLDAEMGARTGGAP
ncbi:efflux RND transporter periplasmic adaptor subunit [Rugamonas rivuli]|uniref:Efflux RND transporter periplasmic adaptor subunit n=1 Tax=Rugamonas rivuli TaxID=2743358 RepID=A0A843SDC0_9BURK|nr:efflux RND transporter periplasmic adaptor subunit [Rugamonas rivuli]MQA18516.1 efflux RND transporter periplasmic adaptor subunit [Rugamonas rivuli]